MSKCLVVFCIGILLVVSCRKPGSGETVLFQQYYAQGELIYNARCSNCHQHSGEGLGLVYPPLNKSDFMEQNFDQMVCLIRNGKRGPLTVNGEMYNQPMPGVPELTDLETAELLTYIYNTWEHEKGIVVVGVLKQCK